MRLVLLLILLTLWIPLGAHANDLQHTSAKQAVMIDYDTGMVLFEKDSESRMPTSSMSKVMTMYLVFEALKSGKLSLDGTLPVSEKAWRKGGSKMFVEVGNQVKVEDLIRGVIIQSGNDATIVLAEGLAGSEKAFAEALTATAKDIGMENSNFTNASGWPDEDHYSTAYDLALLTQALIFNFPEYYHYYSETEFTYNNIRQTNRNPLLYRNMGADGVKTGHTQAGGYGLIGSGTHEGRRVILVVNGLEDDKARAQEGARLLEWGMRGFENVKLFTAGETVDYAYVVMGEDEQAPLMLEQDLTVTVPIPVKNDLKVEVVYEGPVTAPVRKGDQLGTLKVNVPRVTTFELPLMAARDVESLGFFASTLAKARLFITGGTVNAE